MDISELRAAFDNLGKAMENLQEMQKCVKAWMDIEDMPVDTLWSIWEDLDGHVDTIHKMQEDLHDTQDYFETLERRRW